MARTGLALAVLCCLGTLATAQTTDDILFIHHSCGQNWLSSSNGNLSGALAAKEYINEVNDMYYGEDIAPDAGRPDSLSPTPGELTDMNHWVLWFNDYLGGLKTWECASGVNRIVMFKTCYPGSDIGADGTSPGDPFSATKTLTNYEAVYHHPSGWGNSYTKSGYSYKALEEIFAANPDTLFIPVTAPPLRNAGTDDDNAHRARLFNTWLTDTWLPSYEAHTGLHNVAVFDWFDVLANPDDAASYPNRLKAIYGGATSDSHPNKDANLYSTLVFAGGTDNFLDQAYGNFVPEPGTMSLLALGALGLLRRRTFPRRLGR